MDLKKLYFKNETPSYQVDIRQNSEAQGFARARLGFYRSYVGFGDVSLYTPRSVLITFVNSGTEDLHIRDFSSTESAFRLSRQNLSIRPGETALLRVSFTPSTARSYSGSISFRTNDPHTPSGTLFLTGRGIAR